MSINENQEFEAINQKVKERAVNVEEVRQSAADAYREVQMRKKAKAVVGMVAVMGVFGGAVAGCWGLEEIGWINHTFRIVLTSAAGAVAAFKMGRLFEAGGKK